MMDEFCQCKDDWTDGGSICQECGKPRRSEAEIADSHTLTFTQQELLALGACYAAACLGPTAPGIDTALTDAAGDAQAKIQGALWSNR